MLWKYDENGFTVGFPGVAVVKNMPASAWDIRDMGSILGSGRSLRVGNGNPLQYFCLENYMDRGAWPATVRGVAKSWTQWTRLRAHAHTRAHTHTHTCIALLHLFPLHVSSLVNSSITDLMHNNNKARFWRITLCLKKCSIACSNWQCLNSCVHGASVMVTVSSKKHFHFLIVLVCVC